MTRYLNLFDKICILLQAAVHNTENAAKPEVSQRQYNGEPVQCAAFGNPAKDFEQPGEHENVNFRHFFIRPKDKPQNCFNIIVKGMFGFLKG